LTPVPSLGTIQRNPDFRMEAPMARWKMVWITGIAALCVTAPAASAKTLRVTGTERGAMIESQGTTTLYAALGSDQRGAYAARNTTTTGAPGASGAVAFTSKFLDYYALGTEHGTLTGTAVPGPNNTIMIQGTGRVTGGTGRYRHARGTLTFTGTQGADGRYTVSFTGTLTY
jgi:hypothetical protein